MPSVLRRISYYQCLQLLLSDKFQLALTLSTAIPFWIDLFFSEIEHMTLLTLINQDRRTIIKTRCITKPINLFQQVFKILIPMAIALLCQSKDDNDTAHVEQFFGKSLNQTVHRF